MKTILIETVSNGWIVRPFQPCTSWAVEERPAIAVFTKVEDLQKAIPLLLDECVLTAQEASARAKQLTPPEIGRGGEDGK